MDASLAWADYAVIGGYLIFVIILGFWIGRKHEGAEDYFLAGRSMTWVFIGVSLFASNISSTTLIGLAGDAYATGIGVFNYEWMAAVVLVFFAFFLLPFLLRSGVYTLPEFLGLRFGPFARRYFSILTLFLNIIVDTAGSLYAGGIILQLVFPQVDLFWTVMALAIVAGVYTMVGGLAAVIYTDFVQTVFLVVGAIIITWAAYDKVGGWQGMTAGLPAERLSLIRPLSDKSMPWLGLLTGVPILGFYFWCTNQFMAQRALSAKTLNHGRGGLLLAGALKLPVLFIMVLPGTMAIHLYPKLSNADLVYPTLMFNLLPTGLLGLCLAGFIAALMSQIDSTLNSASTLVTMDFIRQAKPDLTPKQLMRVGKITTLVFMVLAALWAPEIQRFKSLFTYLQQVLAYTIPPVVVLFFAAIFSKRANRIGAMVCLTVGTLCGAVLFVLNVIVNDVQIHFLYVVPIGCLVSWIALEIGNRFGTNSDSSQGDQIRWTPEFFKSETIELRSMPWYRNYRIWSVLLLLATAILVISFW
ncbi:sodium:solute symporter [Luteolibacter pohnpeiensis]|uniref:Sodium:solute symporter n=1 Tax=Luteolibacter pohnpeiensis TaxID=454153 RepID=A0A934VPU8_9BACT|nr:sodium:solute symporter [Luteolibacter pohnpeiensis]MBK1881421.1 sodium:solute symporter [Luteolibacter pohnpeiensis]